MKKVILIILLIVVLIGGSIYIFTPKHCGGSGGLGITQTTTTCPCIGTLGPHPTIRTTDYSGFYCTGICVKSECETVSINMRDESIKSKIIEGNDKIALERLEIAIKSGGKREIFYGIRNTLPTSENFLIDIFCDQSINRGDLDEIELNTANEQIIEPGEVEIFQLLVSSVANARADIYSCFIEVNISEGLYDSKRFFVVVES